MKKNYIFTLLLAICFSTLSFGQGSEVFTNSTAPAGYGDGSFVGEGGVTWTFVASRQASGNFSNEITTMNLPALLLRRSSDDSKITSSTISGGLADFSVKLYKGFTGGGDRQVELFVNGESKGTSEAFDDYTEHVFAVTGVNIAGDVVIEIKNTTGKQVIIDEVTWTAYEATSGLIDPMDDFEGNGNITWAADGDTGMDIAFSNPSSTGINTSATVLEYSDTGQQYANINFDLSTDTSIKYDLSTKNVFTLKVFVPTPDAAVTSAKTLALKLQDHSSNTPWESQQVVSVAYEYDVWQELTFDFSAQSAATNFSRIVVQFNGENNYEVVKGYIDDLSYGEAVVADSTLPSVASPAVSASITGGTAGTNYISIYSDDLTSIAVDDLNPNWNQATSASEIQIDGDNTLRYANLNYQGTTFNNDKQDVSGMTHLHIDYHTTNSTELQFFLIVDGVEEAYDIKANEGITTGSWVSLDIPLSNWTIALATLREIKVVGNGTIYFDNWYFYDGATASVDSNNLLGFSMYPNPASNSLNISATETIQKAQIFNILGKNVMNVNVNDTKATLDISNLAAGIYVVKYNVNDKVGIAKFIKQ